jgi:hypothetical protein
MTTKISLIGLSFICVSWLSYAQATKPEIQQKADHSKCSNIVALSGNVSIKCSAMTPEQQRLIEKLPQLLNKILANQLDPDTIMKKLDEIEAAQKAPQTVIAPNGIGSIGGTLINPQVNNFGYMQKDLTPDQIASLSNVIKGFARPISSGDLITCQMGDSNSCVVARSLVKAFRSAGWNLPGSGYGQSLMTEPPESVLIVIRKTGSLTMGKPVTSADGLPSGAYELANALSKIGINVQFSLDDGVPADKFRIVVGTKP